MTWHIDSDIVGILMATIITIRTAGEYRHGTPRQRMFFLSVVFLVISGIMDVCASLALDCSESVLVRRLSMELYYIITYLPLFPWFAYATELLFNHNRRQMRIVMLIGTVPMVLYELAAILNIWVPIFFYFEKDGTYRHAPFFAWSFALYAFYFLMLNFLVIVFGRHLKNTVNRRILLLVPNLGAIGVILQIIFGGWLTIIPFFCLSLVISYLFIEDDTKETTRREYQEEIETLETVVSMDRMTGVLNRVAAEEKIREAILHGKRCCFIIVDIDDLKGINDRYGHAEGDRAIISVAAILQSSRRSIDILARLGGDEFLFFLPDCESEIIIRSVLSRLLSRLDSIHLGENGEKHLGCSIGAVFSSGEMDYETLYKRADEALYHSKNNGKNVFSVYSDIYK